MSSNSYIEIRLPYFFQFGTPVLFSPAISKILPAFGHWRWFFIEIFRVDRLDANCPTNVAIGNNFG